MTANLSGTVDPVRFGDLSLPRFQPGELWLAGALISSGLSPETPSAVVCDATTPRQRVLVTTLGRVAAEAVALGLRSPSIVAIGEMVKLRAALTPFAIMLETGSLENGAEATSTLEVAN